MKTIVCSDEVYNTIYTALRLEYEINYGCDEEVVNLLKRALDAVQAALDKK